MLIKKKIGVKKKIRKENFRKQFIAKYNDNIDELEVINNYFNKLLNINNLDENEFFKIINIIQNKLQYCQEYWYIYDIEMNLIKLFNWDFDQNKKEKILNLISIIVSKKQIFTNEISINLQKLLQKLILEEEYLYLSFLIYGNLLNINDSFIVDNFFFGKLKKIILNINNYNKNVIDNYHFFISKMIYFEIKLEFYIEFLFYNLNFFIERYEETMFKNLLNNNIIYLKKNIVDITNNIDMFWDNNLNNENNLDYIINFIYNLVKFDIDFNINKYIFEYIKKRLLDIKKIIYKKNTNINILFKLIYKITKMQYENNVVFIEIFEILNIISFNICNKENYYKLAKIYNLTKRIENFNWDLSKIKINGNNLNSKKITELLK